MFLFNDLLILAKPKSDGSYRLKLYIPLHTAWVYLDPKVFSLSLSLSLSLSVSVFVSVSVSVSVSVCLCLCLSLSSFSLPPPSTLE